MTRKEIYRARKQSIRDFFEHFTDERLVWLREHARREKLSYHSCCCFIGIANADHALQASGIDAGKFAWGIHLTTARQLKGAEDAERAFYELGVTSKEENLILFNPPPNWRDMDARRRRILVPMVKAEIRRRERLRAQEKENVELQVV